MDISEKMDLSSIAELYSTAKRDSLQAACNEEEILL